MKLAVFTGALTPVGRGVIDYFPERGLPLSVVIVETALRRKLSATERAHRSAHAELERRLGSGGSVRTPGERLFNRLPWQAKWFARRWAHLIPLLAGRTTVQAARRHGIPVEFVRRHSSSETRAILERYRIDLVLLCGSQWLIKEPLFSIPGLRIINAHCGKLPFHRSLDSVGWSVMAGDETGLTTHVVDAGIDTGPMLLYRRIDAGERDRYGDLVRRIEAAKPEVLFETVQGLITGHISAVPQDPAAGTHHRPMTVDELMEVVRRMEALSTGREPSAG